jgi:hypothetical protein
MTCSVIVEEVAPHPVAFARARVTTKELPGKMMSLIGVAWDFVRKIRRAH